MGRGVCIKFSYALLTKKKEVQRVSALHSGNKVVDGEAKRDACPLAPGIDRQPNAQFIAESFAQVQAKPGGTKNGAAIVPGKTLLKNTGQIAQWDSNSIIFNI